MIINDGELNPIDKQGIPWKLFELWNGFIINYEMKNLKIFFLNSKKIQEE